MIRCVVVDAESRSRRSLIKALGDFPGFAVTGEARSLADGRRLIRDQAPSALFLSASSDGCKELSLIRDIPAAHRPATVVIADRPEHAPVAFDLDVADFMVRPFDTERLMRACMRVQRSGTAEPPVGSIAVAHGNRRLRLQIGDIMLVQSTGNYVNLRTRVGDYQIRSTLTRMEQQLKNLNFCRVSRTALVNVELIDELERTSHGDAFLWLRSGDKVAVSRSFRRAVEALV